MAELLSLRYFPQYPEESAIDLLTSTYGDAAYRIYRKLLNEIYFVRGYYFPLSDETITHFMAKYRFNDNSRKKLKETLAFLIREKIFDLNLYNKFRILTSSVIQENFFRVHRRKRNLARVVRQEYLTDFSIRKFGKMLKLDSIIEESDGKNQTKLNELKESLKENFTKENDGLTPSEVALNKQAQAASDCLHAKRELEKDKIYCELYDKFNVRDETFKDGKLAAGSEFWQRIYTKLLNCMVFFVKLNKKISFDSREISADGLIQIIYWIEPCLFDWLCKETAELEKKEDLNDYNFYMMRIIAAKYWEWEENKNKSILAQPGKPKKPKDKKLSSNKERDYDNAE